MRINKSPNKVSLLKLKPLPASITKAPLKPKTSPSIFCQVAFSWLKKKEITKTRMGVIIIISAAFIGVVMLKPAKTFPD